MDDRVENDDGNGKGGPLVGRHQLQRRFSEGEISHTSEDSKGVATATHLWRGAIDSVETAFIPDLAAIWQ